MLSASLLFIHLIGCSFVLMKCCIRFGFIFLSFFATKNSYQKQKKSYQSAETKQECSSGAQTSYREFPRPRKSDPLKMLFPFLVVLETIRRKCRVSTASAVVKRNFPCKIFAKLFIHSHARIKYQFLCLVRQVLFLIKMYESLEEERRRKRENRSRKVKRGEMSVL